MHGVTGPGASPAGPRTGRTIGTTAPADEVGTTPGGVVPGPSEAGVVTIGEKRSRTESSTFASSAGTAGSSTAAGGAGASAGPKIPTTTPSARDATASSIAGARAETGVGEPSATGAAGGLAPSVVAGSAPTGGAGSADAATAAGAVGAAGVVARTGAACSRPGRPA